METKVSRMGASQYSESSFMQAFAESEMSLCAPFLAFDPVMQFVVGVAVLPITCTAFDFGCDEIKNSFPVHHILSVLSIG